nr:oligosaccharide flippase family protein [Extibacter muris]
MLQDIKNKIKSLFAGGFFHVFAGSILAKLIAFISSVVIVRLVTKVDYAYLAYADNLYNYVISLAGMGMTAAILKYCATAKTKEEDKAYFGFALKYGTIVQCFFSVLIVGYVLLGNIPFPGAKEVVCVLVLYPVLSNVLSAIMNYLRAHSYNQLYAKTAVIQTIVVFLASVLFVLLVGINGIAIARYLAIGAAVAVTLKVVRSELGGVERKKLEKSQMKSFMAMALSLMISNLFSSIMPINEMTLVNEVLRDEVITANYKIAIMIPSQLVFVSQSIIIYYFTIIAKLENGLEIWRLSKKIGIVTGILVGVIGGAGAVCTPIIIRFVYGSKYEDAIPLALFFWLIYVLNAGFRMIPMNLLPAIGVVKFNAVMAGVSCVSHLVLTYMSIKILGIWGVGIATGIVYLITGVLYWVYYKRKCAENNYEII